MDAFDYPSTDPNPPLVVVEYRHEAMGEIRQSVGWAIDRNEKFLKVAQTRVTGPKPKFYCCDLIPPGAVVSVRELSVQDSFKT